MEKYTIVFKHNSGVQVNHPNHQKWLEATPETHPSLYDVSSVVVKDGRVFIKKPKHFTGVINRQYKGGKWEEITHLVIRTRVTSKRTIEDWLKDTNAQPATFRGGPRIK